MDNEEQSAAAADVQGSISTAQPVPLDPKDPAPAPPTATAPDDMDLDADATPAAGGGGTQARVTNAGDDTDSEEEAPTAGRRRRGKADDLQLFSDDDDDEGFQPTAARSASRKRQTLADDDDDDEDGGDDGGGRRDVDGPAAERGGGAAELARRRAAAKRARDEEALKDLIPDDPEDEDPEPDDDMFGEKDDGMGGLDDDDDDADPEQRARLEQLEYRETDEPYEEPPREFRIAQLYLADHPVRRTKEHWLARLPNFLDYRTQPFDAETFDPETDDNAGTGSGELSVKERLADPELRMLMKTKNTMRWRWSDRVDEDNVKMPESNARIVRWSDGTMSLQLGDEFFDVPLNREGGGSAMNIGPAQVNDIVPPASQGLTNGASQTQSSSQAASSSTSSSAQPTSFIVVPHREAQVLQAEVPLAGVMLFRPYNLQSETHRKLAKAVKYHKVLRVQATQDLPQVDPEAEKLAREKRMRDEERKRMREANKQKSVKDEEDDDVDAQLKQYSAITGEVRQRHSAAGGGSKGVAGGRTTLASRRRGDIEEDYEEDDFIVADESDQDGSGDEDEDEDEDGNDEEEQDGDEDGEGGTPRKKKKDKRRKSDAMDIDDEPDEMELAERRIEENERAEKLARQEQAARDQEGGKPVVAPRSNVLADSDDDEGSGVPAASSAPGQQPASTAGAGNQAGSAGENIPSGSAADGEDAAGVAGAEARRKKRVILDEDDEE